MKDSDVHLRTILTVHIRITNFLQNIQPLLHFPEHCMFARQREDIGLGKGDKEIAIIQIGA